MSGDVSQCLSFGATLLSADRTHFRFWAPACSQVLLEIDGHPPQAMQAVAGGWHELEAACGAGARYRYAVGDGLSVPDPASRFQPEDVQGPSAVVDPAAYRWQQRAWQGRPWPETVIYELHVGLCGGYAGVAARLPALAELGITAVELMPIADFPGARNWGYDGVLPFAPDAAYGTPEQLKALIDTAHGLGLMIFLDVVYNHFGPDGNFLHAYAPQFFREDLHTPWGAAIDFRRREVRDYYTANALYWLDEYRFDGLRFDAVHAISEPDWLDEMAAIVRAGVEPGRHIHLMLENERNAAEHLGYPDIAPGLFDAQWNDDGHNALHVLLTGERESYYQNYADAPAQHLARVLGEGFAYQGEAMPSHGGKPRGTRSAQLPPTAFILFLQNHDQVGNRALGERLSLLADPEGLRAAVALQLLCPQIPLLFLGEDWGSRAPFLFFTDFHDELADAVREGRRKEFAGFKAFSNEGTRAQIPDPNAVETFKRSMPDDEERQRPEHLVVTAGYRQLLALRRQHLVPHLVGARSLGATALSEFAVVAGWRLGDGSEWRIACNLGATAVPLMVIDDEPIFETAKGAAAEVASGRLPGHSTIVFLKVAPSNPLSLWERGRGEGGRESEPRASALIRPSGAPSPSGRRNNRGAAA